MIRDHRHKHTVESRMCKQKETSCISCYSFLIQEVFTAIKINQSLRLLLMITLPDIIP